MAPLPESHRNVAVQADLTFQGDPTDLLHRMKSMGRRNNSCEGDSSSASPDLPTSGPMAAGQGEEPLRPRSRAGVGDVLAALKGYAVHVVYAGAGGGEQPAVLSPLALADLADDEVSASAADPCAVAGDIEVILVLVDVHFTQAAIQLLHKFKARLRSPAPTVVAMLMQPPGMAEDMSPTFTATSVLAAAPCDDIILQPSARDDLPAMLAIIMEKVERKTKLELGCPITNSRSAGDRAAPAPLVGAATLASLRGGQATLRPDEPSQASGSSCPSSARRKGYGNMWDECRLLRRLRHPNIICMQAIVDAQLSRPLKCAGAPNLRIAIISAGGHLPIETAQSIFWQIACGLAYCHDPRIAHRNLKPESIMVENEVALANFNLAVKLGAGRHGAECRDKCGTMPFVAPEVLAGRRYDALAADVWSVGVVLLEMLCGINKLPRMLGWAPTPTPSRERAMDIERFFSDPTELLASLKADLGDPPESLLELVPKLLCVAPSSRPLASEARDSSWARLGARELASEGEDTPSGVAAEEEEDHSDDDMATRLTTRLTRRS